MQFSPVCSQRNRYDDSDAAQPQRQKNGQVHRDTPDLEQPRQAKQYQRVREDGGLPLGGYVKKHRRKYRWESCERS